MKLQNIIENLLMQQTLDRYFEKNFENEKFIAGWEKNDKFDVLSDLDACKKKCQIFMKFEF